MSARRSVTILEDWFVKSPPLCKMKNMQSWKKRYFALCKVECTQNVGLIKNYGLSFYLIYWSNKKEKIKGRPPIRMLSLEKDCKVQTTDHPYQKEMFPFVLSLSTFNRTFYLCACDEITKMLWHDTILQVITATRGSDYAIFLRTPIYEKIPVPKFDEESGTDTKSSSSAESNSAEASYCTNDEHQSRQLTDKTLTSLTDETSRLLSASRYHMNDSSDSINDSYITVRPSSNNTPPFVLRTDLYPNNIVQKTRALSLDSGRQCVPEHSTEHRSTSLSSDVRRGYRKAPTKPQRLSKIFQENEPSIKISMKPSSTDDLFYDVPKSSNSLKRITFQDIHIDLPHSSVVQMSGNVMKVRTRSGHFEVCVEDEAEQGTMNEKPSDYEKMNEELSNYEKMSEMNDIFVEEEKTEVDEQKAMEDCKEEYTTRF